MADRGQRHATYMQDDENEHQICERRMDILEHAFAATRPAAAFASIAVVIGMGRRHDL